MPATMSTAMDSAAMDVEPPATAVAATQAPTKKPKFKKATAAELNDGKKQYRKVPVPPHRMAPIKKDWMKLYTPLVKQMKLQVRMNTRARAVEIRTGKDTEDMGSIQKAADFVHAYCLGFAVDDAMALLRMEDIYVDTFEIKDVKTLSGDNLSRAIGRIAGKDGRSKFAIENTSKTRLVIADTKIHILGSFSNIKIARDAVVNLILGASPGKVYSNLRNISARLKERY